MANPYLRKLHDVIGTQQSQNLKTRRHDELPKLTKPRSVSFGSDERSRFFQSEGARRADEADAFRHKPCDTVRAPAQKSASSPNCQNRQNLLAYGRFFAVLRKRCPTHIELVRWRQAIEDGERFLAEWVEQAEALGWTSRDLFGLHEVPTYPHPTYQRLSRYDCTGLIWLLQGCPVVALTETTAAIRMPTGNLTRYRKHNKPAFGPLGDSLDDFLA